MYVAALRSRRMPMPYQILLNLELFIPPSVVARIRPSADGRGRSNPKKTENSVSWRTSGPPKTTIVSLEHTLDNNEIAFCADRWPLRQTKVNNKQATAENLNGHLELRQANLQKTRLP